MCAGFLCPKCDNFASLHTRQDHNELHLKRWLFLPKSGSSVSQSQAHLAQRKRIGWSVGFNSWTNWALYGIVPMSLCKIRLNDSSEMFRMNWCWWRFTHTLSATAAIFSGSLVYRWGCQFLLIIFHKITNIRSWRCFSSSKIRTKFSHTFCNITMIFKVMSQYFPALFKRIYSHIRLAEG